jgi:alpha-L-rhamnosidase
MTIKEIYYTMRFFSLLLLLLAAAPCAAQAAGLVPVRLRCEYRVDPLGIDTSHPRLGWILQAGDPAMRGIRQTAYHVLVASSPARLSAGQGDLWDSGLVSSPRMNHIFYAGKPLESGRQVWWKVQITDQNAAASKWSAPTQWVMGILRDADWQGAKWIGAAAAPRPETSNAALIGYHAAEATQPEEVKWVQIDLGRPCPITDIRLYPMQHAGIDGFGFPKRFTVEGADDEAFQNPAVIADQTASDFPNPGAHPVTFDGKGITARYVRVTTAKLWLREASVTGHAAYCFALHRLEVVSGGRDVAAGSPVSAKDSIESPEWGKAGLTLPTAGSAAVRSSASTDSLLLRRRFTVKPRLIRALAFVCGLGQYEMTVNGVKAGRDLLTPGWTRYDKTCLYDTYDITAALHPGANAVGLFLGNGFYNIHSGRYTKITCSFGPQRAIGLLRLTYADGTTANIVTDEHWKVGAGPITFSSVYGGEAYDARLVFDGWDKPAFRDADWDLPVVTAGPGGTLKGLSASGPPIRRFDVLTPIGSKVLSPSATVYDLGRNASLMLRLKVRGPAGSSVKVTPSELVSDNGDINDTMCGGDSYWTYTLSGHGDETYLSHFYYRGGRYLKVECLAAPGSDLLPVVEFVAGDTIHADAPPVGQFSCSNARFNSVSTLIRRAQENNMVSIMTDCPTREKLGWLEEDHLNGPALRYNFDLSTLMTKMAGDMADSQRADGLVPSTCPDFPQWGEGEFTNPPEWGSACIAVPWQQYQFEGDLELLRRHYPMMKRYVDYLSARAEGGIVSFGLGDWYDNHSFGAATLTPIGITATAFYYYDTQTLAKVAALLGKPDDAAHYEKQASEILTAYTQKFFNAATDTYATGSQASNAFPLGMGMVEEAHRPAVLENLAKDLQVKGPTAGEVSLEYLLRALADGGHSELIYTTFNTDTQGYGLQVKLGKTSLTEGWNGGASQDHFMFGQINEWFYRSLAGIQDDPSGPGFQKIIIKPALVSGLAWTEAHYDSLQGTIVSAWKRDRRSVTLHVVIPANTTATVYLPTTAVAAVTESGTPAVRAVGVKFLRRDGQNAVYQLGSGEYRFAAPLLAVH